MNELLVLENVKVAYNLPEYDEHYPNPSLVVELDEGNKEKLAKWTADNKIGWTLPGVPCFYELDDKTYDSFHISNDTCIKGYYNACCHKVPTEYYIDDLRAGAYVSLVLESKYIMESRYGGREIKLVSIQIIKPVELEKSKRLLERKTYPTWSKEESRKLPTVWCPGEVDDWF